MKIKIILNFIFVFLCIIVYGFFAIKKKSGRGFAINIDLAKPVAIEWPCEVSIVGDKGEKGLRIAPGVGRGWRDEAGGQADYRFFIPEDDKYYIWAYCLWYDECANAIFAKVDDHDKAIIGNDPVYNKWHWIRGFDIKLEKGTHNLVLSNHSDHIALEKIIFSNSASASPQQTGIVFSDIFYDGFDGCDRGNFTSWQQISDSWLVQNPDSQTSVTENVLIGQSQDKAFIIYKNTEWQEYNLDVLVKVLPFDSKGGIVGICFGLTDPNNFHQLRIQPVQNSETAEIAVIDGDLTVVSEFKLPFEINRWQQIQISLKSGQIEIRFEEHSPVQIKAKKRIVGGIGFLLEGRIEAYFDNIHVRKITQIKQEKP